MLTSIEAWQLQVWHERDLDQRIARLKASRAEVYRRFDIAWAVSDEGAIDALDQLGTRLRYKIDALIAQYGD